jgi:hypothetical protein
MNAARRLTLLALALALAGAAACNADRTTGPSTAPSFAKKTRPPINGGGTDTTGTGRLTEEQLKQWELREKARVEAEKQASLATYDSLKIEWDQVLKLYPDGNTGSSGPVYCDPLSYDADVKIMGPEGGDMSIGPHKLSIPEGALKNRVVITGEMPVSMAVTVRLSPHGLVFAKQPKLTLSYKHCLRPTDYRERVAYTDESLKPLEFPASRDYTEYGLVAAWLNHFSRYAVWY